MVEMRYTLFLRLFATCFTAPLGFLIMIALNIYSGIDKICGVNIEIIGHILSLIVAIGMWYIMSNTKFVFDDSGITLKEFINPPNKSANFWNIPFMHEHFIPWDSDEIFEVDALSGSIITFWKPHKKKYGNHAAMFLGLDYFVTNRKEAMRFAADKLPPYKFTDNARKVLRTWGITV